MIKIFVSHSTKYADIAKSLMLSLQTLESETLLDIKISEAMAGATDWRQWIEDNVRSADVFLLLFPHPKMDLGWSNYEFGRFYDKTRKVVCIKNTDILKPPPQFEPYQAYNADEAGILKFIDELFVKGIFTDGTPINAQVGELTGEFHQRAQNVACELAQKFTLARVKEHFYARRIVLSACYDKTKRFDATASTVQGNDAGLHLLGLDNVEKVSWSTVRQSVGDQADWPSALERALQSITTGVLPRGLPPFLKSEQIYIPVIAKAESMDSMVHEVVLIFVSVNMDVLQSMLAWSVPSGMPDTFALLVRLVRMMFTARWDILEPRYKEAKYNAPTPERFTEIISTVVADFDRLRHDLERQGIRGLEQFYAVFSLDLRTDIEACGEEWTQFINALRASPVLNPGDLSSRLKNLLDNNSKWLELGARQFAHRVGELH
jgi:hypothetical protein